MKISVVASSAVASTKVVIIKQFLSSHSEGCVNAFSMINFFVFANSTDDEVQASTKTHDTVNLFQRDNCTEEHLSVLDILVNSSGVNHVQMKSIIVSLDGRQVLFD